MATRPANSVTIPATSLSDSKKRITVNFTFKHMRRPRGGDLVRTTVSTSADNFTTKLDFDVYTEHFHREARLERLLQGGGWSSPFIETHSLGNSPAERGAIRAWAEAHTALIRVRRRDGALLAREEGDTVFNPNQPRYNEYVVIPAKPMRDPYGTFESNGVQWRGDERIPGGGTFVLTPKAEPAIMQRIGQAVTYRWISDPPFGNANALEFYSITPSDMASATMTAITFAAFYLQNGPANERVKKAMDPLGPPQLLYQNAALAQPEGASMRESLEVFWFPQSGTDQLGFRVMRTPPLPSRYGPTVATKLVRASDLERRIPAVGWLPAVDLIGMGEGITLNVDELRKVVAAWKAVHGAQVGPIPRFPFTVTLVMRNGQPDVRLVNVAKTAERVKRNQRTFFEFHRLPESKTIELLKASAAELETAPLEFSQVTLPASEAQRILTAYDHWLSLGQVRGV